MSEPFPKRRVHLYVPVCRKEADSFLSLESSGHFVLSFISPKCLTVSFLAELLTTPFLLSAYKQQRARLWLQFSIAYPSSEHTHLILTQKDSANSFLRFELGSLDRRAILLLIRPMKLDFSLFSHKRALPQTVGPVTQLVFWRAFALLR